jgi:hypothetical protein
MLSFKIDVYLVDYIDQNAIPILDYLIGVIAGMGLPLPDDPNLAKEISLRLMASITPVANVTQECSAASWTYLLNLFSSQPWAIGCKYFFNF